MRTRYGLGVVLVVGWFSASTALAGTIDYSYDDAGRLVRADYGTSRIDYTYDNNGNLSRLDSAGGIPTVVLPHNRWQQFALPANPGSSNRLVDIFGDDIAGEYGITWQAYRYDTASDSYVELNALSVMSQGEGFWIIQITGSDVTVDMPESSTATPVSTPQGCVSAAGCFAVPVSPESGSVQWNMLGYMFTLAGPLADFRVVTGTSTPVFDCSAGEGCTLAQARAAGVLHDVFWRYVDESTGYEAVRTGDSLNPWNGFWAAALSEAPPVTSLIVPKP